MTREEAVKRIKQNISAAEFHMGLTQLRSTIENELLDIEAFKMAIKALEVDLVLCKECKYYKPEFYACTAKGWNLSATHYPKVHESGFCYKGKRRSDD